MSPASLTAFLADSGEVRHRSRKARSEPARVKTDVNRSSFSSLVNSSQFFVFICFFLLACVCLFSQVSNFCGQFVYNCLEFRTVKTIEPGIETDSTVLQPAERNRFA